MSEDYEDREGFVFTFPGLAGAADDVCVTGQRRGPPRDGLVRLHPSAAPYLLREWALDRNTATRLERLSRAALGRNLGLRGAPYGLTRILEPLIRAFDVETLVVWGPKRIAVAEPAVFPARPGEIDERPDDASSTTWIEIVLVDQDGAPVADEEYNVVLPDGSRRAGRLDERGFARLDGIVAGTCDVSFPRIDGREWGR